MSYIPPNLQPEKKFFFSKIHKPNNPSRPIISNNNIVTEHLSHFVEADIIDFLNKFKKIKTVPQNAILATLDAFSFYTIITHNSGLKAL